jgi:1,4-dihydroxy-2-naphthoyl-CoA hydrolase
MFVHQVTVQLHHTDAYGIIFFANQFKFCHDTFQEWLVSVGLPLPPTRPASGGLLVIVHAESDYLAPIRVGERLSVTYHCERIGTTSVSNAFRLTDRTGAEVGRVRTVHVMIDVATNAKMELPVEWRNALATNCT